MTESNKLYLVQDQDKNVTDNMDNDNYDTMNTEHNIMKGDKEMSDKYVTKDELDYKLELTSSKLENKIDILSTKIDGQFKVIDEKFNTVDEKFNTINSKIDNLTKLVWWIFGLIAAGIIIPALASIIKTLFLK
jgi:hypothetical protein